MLGAQVLEAHHHGWLQCTAAVCIWRCKGLQKVFRKLRCGSVLAMRRHWHDCCVPTPGSEGRPRGSHAEAGGYGRPAQSCGSSTEAQKPASLPFSACPRTQGYVLHGWSTTTTNATNATNASRHHRALQSTTHFLLLCHVPVVRVGGC